MSAEFTKYGWDTAIRFVSGDIVFGEHVKAHMKEWADSWKASGDIQHDTTRVVVVTRLVKEGLIVDMVNNPISKTHLHEIVGLLQTIYRRQCQLYLDLLTSNANKQVAKETILLVDVAMKDCGHVFCG